MYTNADVIMYIVNNATLPNTASKWKQTFTPFIYSSMHAVEEYTRDNICDIETENAEKHSSLSWSKKKNKMLHDLLALYEWWSRFQSNLKCSNWYQNVQSNIANWIYLDRWSRFIWKFFGTMIFFKTIKIRTKLPN